MVPTPLFLPVRPIDGHKVAPQDRDPVMQILRMAFREDLAWPALLLIARLYLLFSEGLWNVLPF